MGPIDPARAQHFKDMAAGLNGTRYLARAFEMTGLDLAEAQDPADPSNGLVLKGDAEAALLRHQLVVGGNANVQATNSAASHSGTGSAKAEEEKKSAEAMRNQLLQQLQDAANAYFDQAAKHYAEAERYRQLARETMEKIEQLQETKGAIDDALDDEKFDREKAIAALKKAGVEVPEGASEEEIRRLLLLQQQKIQDEIDGLSVKFDDYTTRAEEETKIGDELTRRGNELLKRMKEVDADSDMTVGEAESEKNRIEEEMQKLLKHEHAELIREETAEQLKDRITGQDDEMTATAQTTKTANMTAGGPGF